MKESKLRSLLFAVALILLLPAVSLAAVLQVDSTVKEAGIPFKLYHLAACDSGKLIWDNEQYRTACGSMELVNELSGLSSETISKYARAVKAVVDDAQNKIEPTDLQETNAEGMLNWSDLESGLYFLVAEDYLNKAKTYWYTFPPTLIHLASGELEVQLKPVRRNATDLIVKKVWKDSSKPSARPAYIEVVLLRDGEVYIGTSPLSPVRLSQENNWTYHWTGLDPDHHWSAAERVVPEGYTASTEYNMQTDILTITNELFVPKGGSLPQTGQLWWPVPVLLIVGMTCFVIGWNGKRWQEHHGKKQ